MTKHYRSDYLDDVFNLTTFTRIVIQSIATVKKIREEVPFDTIAFCGQSGAAMAYILSAELNVHLINIRKDDSSHFVRENGKFEGHLHAKKYLIVDDFICGGSTVKRIIETVTKEIPTAECIGMFLYSHYSSKSSWKVEGTEYRCWANKEAGSYKQLGFSFP